MFWSLEPSIRLGPHWSHGPLALRWEIGLGVSQNTLSEGELGEEGPEPPTVPPVGYLRMVLGCRGNREEGELSGRGKGEAFEMGVGE